MRKNKILLVEDEPIISRIHTLFLEKMGFDVACASSGRQTLEMYASNCYRLVILDGKLPDMRGIDIGKEIRNLERKNKMLRKPILLLSAYSTKLLKQWCKEAEIDSFANKPIRFNVLFSMLNHCLNKASCEHGTV